MHFLTKNYTHLKRLQSPLKVQPFCQKMYFYKVLCKATYSITIGFAINKTNELIKRKQTNIGWKCSGQKIFPLSYLE